MDRRQAMQTGAAIVAVAALPIPALADNDSELLALERELIRHTDMFNASHDWSEDEFNRLGAENTALEYRIAEMPAKSTQGVAVKLRRLRLLHEPTGRGYWNDVWSEDLFDTAQAALEQLGAS